MDEWIGMRSVRTLVTTCVAVTLACGIGVVAAATATGSVAAATPTASIAGEPPNQILARSLAGARAEHSVHVVEVEHVGAQVLTQTDNSDERSGEQILAFSTGAHVDIRRLRTILYIKANALGIETVYGKQDATYANKWISVPSSNSAFTTLAMGIDFPSLLSEMPPTGRLSKSRVETIAGHRVIVVSGRPNQVAEKVSGTETFDVSVHAPYLPPRLTGRLTEKKHTATLTIGFGDWGHNFVVHAPATSTKISDTNLLG